MEFINETLKEDKPFGWKYAMFLDYVHKQL